MNVHWKCDSNQQPATSNQQPPQCAEGSDRILNPAPTIWTYTARRTHASAPRFISASSLQNCGVKFGAQGNISFSRPAGRREPRFSLPQTLGLRLRLGCFEYEGCWYGSDRGLLTAVLLSNFVKHYCVEKVGVCWAKRTCL